MNPSDMKAFLERHGLTLTAGAEALGKDRNTLSRMCSGVVTIDRTTELATKAIDAGLDTETKSEVVPVQIQVRLSDGRRYKFGEQS